MSGIETLHARITDVDSHEMMPTKLWADAFGPLGAMLAPVYEMIEASGRTTSGNATVIDWDADETEISPDTVWTIKGARAPGAISLERRLEVLDVMGVDRQLIFPGFGLFGIAMVSSTRESLEQQLGIDASGFDFQAMALEIQRAHNEWALREGKADPTRLRAVRVLCCTSDFDQMMSEAEHLLAEGARAIQIPASVPPGGKSPADRAIDPFWSLFEEADAAVLLHLGSEASFFGTRVWGMIPDFDPEMVNLEFPLDPYSFSVVHMAQENFVIAATLGGVFERHPSLRFGVIECGAHWVGPMAENIDMWAEKFPRRLKKTLSMPPSAYVNRNVRVTPYHFEPVDRYIERFGLEDVYCFGSDYPHMEGGKNSLHLFADRIGRLGDEIFEKFFVTNGQWLVPD